MAIVDMAFVDMAIVDMAHEANHEGSRCRIAPTSILGRVDPNESNCGTRVASAERQIQVTLALEGGARRTLVGLRECTRSVLMIKRSLLAGFGTQSGVARDQGVPDRRNRPATRFCDDYFDVSVNQITDLLQSKVDG
jgi:hypothetical protein